MNDHGRDYQRFMIYDIDTGPVTITRLIANGAMTYRWNGGAVLRRYYGYREQGQVTVDWDTPNPVVVFASFPITARDFGYWLRGEYVVELLK